MKNLFFLVLFSCFFSFFPPFIHGALPSYKHSSPSFPREILLLWKILFLCNCSFSNNYSSYIKSPDNKCGLQRIKRLRVKKAQLLYSSLFWQYPLYYITSISYNTSVFRIYEIEILMSNKLLFMGASLCRGSEAFSFF